MHQPLEHDFPPEHMWPQLPQLLESVLRLTQVPLQSVSPPGQTQAPPWQTLPPGQALPHEPQLFGSDWVFMQELEQQLWPEEHWVPHWPQLLGSLVVSLQTPPHILPPAHGLEQPRQGLS